MVYFTSMVLLKHVDLEKGSFFGILVYFLSCYEFAIVTFLFVFNMYIHGLALGETFFVGVGI